MDGPGFLAPKVLHLVSGPLNGQQIPILDLPADRCLRFFRQGPTAGALEVAAYQIIGFDADGLQAQYSHVKSTEG